MPKLYLIPTLLSDNNWTDVLPVGIKNICSDTKYFIVENIRTARRFLKKVDKHINIDELTFYELNKHTTPSGLHKALTPLLNGNNAGVISEAGCPGIADPGAEIVNLAHERGIQVVPLVGPSSIILSLMASGMNGQNFAFIGYLPVKPAERNKKIKQVEQRSRLEKQTQIFIETPYRNNQLAEDLVKTCLPHTKLCIACNITSGDEYIATKKIKDWKGRLPDLHKKPTIFSLMSAQM